MRIEQIQYLLEIARQKTLNEAAKNLYLSPQSLGRSITSLEEDLGCKLIERTPKGIVLTEECLAILPMAKNILAEYEQMHTTIAQKDLQTLPQNMASDNIRIFARQIIYSSIFPAVLKDFKKKYPKVVLSMSEFIDTDFDNSDGDFFERFLQSISVNILQKSARTDNIMILFNAHHKQLGLLNNWCKENAMRYWMFFAGEIICFANKNALLSKQSTISVAQICKKQIPVIRLANTSEDPNQFPKHLDIENLSLNVVLQTSDIDIFIQMLESNEDMLGIINEIVLSSHSDCKHKFDGLHRLKLNNVETRLYGWLYSEACTDILKDLLEIFPKCRI